MWVIGTQLLALIVAMTIQYYCYDRVWTPLQRFYFSAYVRSQILMRFGISSGTYQLLTIKDAKGTRPAIDTDVTTAPASDGTLVLSKKSVQAGALELIYDSPGQYNNLRMNAYLRDWVYHDKSLLRLLRPSVIGGMAILVLGLIAVIPKKWERLQLRRYGRQLKGPELLRTVGFNRRTQADGISFATNEQLKLGRPTPTTRLSPCSHPTRAGEPALPADGRHRHGEERVDSTDSAASGRP